MSGTHRFSFGDVVTVALAAGAAVVVFAPGATTWVLPVLVVALTTWPIVLLGLLFTRWLRRGDVRFAALTALLVIVAVGGVLTSTWLYRG